VKKTETNSDWKEGPCEEVLERKVRCWESRRGKSESYRAPKEKEGGVKGITNFSFFSQ